MYDFQRLFAYTKCIECCKISTVKLVGYYIIIQDVEDVDIYPQ